MSFWMNLFFRKNIKILLKNLKNKIIKIVINFFYKILVKVVNGIIGFVASNCIHV